MPREDRQRKIPRRYRNEYATAAQLEHIALAGRSGQGVARAKQFSSLAGVVPAVIGRLADFRECVIQRLAALALQQRDEMRPPLFQQHCRFLQDFRALPGRRPAPGFESPPRGYDRFVRVLRRRIDDASDKCGLVDRADELAGRACCCLAVDERRCRDRRGFSGDRGEQLVQRRALAEFDAARILPLRSEEIAWQGDVRMPRVIGADDDFGRTPQQRCNRHIVVGGDRHERRVGAILE